MTTMKYIYVDIAFNHPTTFCLSDEQAKKTGAVQGVSLYLSKSSPILLIEMKKVFCTPSTHTMHYGSIRE